MKIRQNVKISDLVTMRIGGNAKYVFELETETDILDARAKLKELGLKNYYFLGGGANTFATDAEFDGAIILNRFSKIDYEVLDESHIKFIVGGGTKWDDFVDQTTALGCTGVECLAGIPGTVGAAPVQNIGAYGQEVKSVISKIHVVDFLTGEQKTFELNDCDFSYRHSIFNSTKAGQYFIVKVEFILEKGEISGELYGSLQAYLTEQHITSREPKILATAVRTVRDSKLPHPETIASAGSFFKNIYVKESDLAMLDEKGIPHHGTKVNTGWLIEQAGLKGKIFHGFRISDAAALVLINESGKSYHDLELAVAKISNIVFEKFGFTLEQEPNVIGL